MKNKNFYIIILFILVFFLLWIARQYIYVHIDSSISGVVKTMFGVVIKGCIWLGLMLLFRRLVYHEEFFADINFSLTKKTFLYASIFGAILFTINVILNKVAGNSLVSWNVSFGGILSAVIFAPIIEEIVFRGFIMLKLNEFIGCPTVNIITSLLFVGIHIPGWIIWGDGFILKNAVSIFLVSFVFGSSFIISKKNIAYPILFHTANNCIAMLV